MRILDEMNLPKTGALQRAWHDATPDAGDAPSAELAASPPSAATATNRPPIEAGPAGTAGAPALIGRKQEMDRLMAAVGETAATSRERVILLTGEPGVGKTRIATEVIADVRRRGGVVLDGTAYEVESSRPYGPWIDALRRLSPDAVDAAIRASLAPLMPELPNAPEAELSRDRLFSAVAQLLKDVAGRSPPLVFAIDDVQWCDEASIALLHFTSRMCRDLPIVFMLAAREGELTDNVPVTRALRSLRQDNVLDEIAVGPLNRIETERLVRHLAPDLDAERVHEQSAGNPLFALEIARTIPDQESSVPQSLGEIVRDRIERLTQPAAEVLRWAAVVGHHIDIQQLREVVSLAPDGLMSSLETLERHALLRGLPDSKEFGGRYTFAHDVVREVVYAEISEPRRRMMHWRFAKLLEDAADPDDTIAGEIARHASLAGEMAMAARACISAGRRCLRIFANAEAFSLARRGMRYAARVDQPESVKLMLELTQISFAARRPLAPDDAARSLEEMAERALDHGALEHARLGFNALAYLRWESGEWSDAVRSTMKAEMVSRSASEEERVVAMAEAAHCLALLERNLGQAEAMLLEADALSKRAAVETFAIPDGIGMLRMHRGEYDTAARLFEDARMMARRDGARLSEFIALEHLIVLELQRERYAEARALSQDLLEIGEKFREGSEAPVARTLAALTRYAVGEDGALGDIDDAIEELRAADAKHRLSIALSFAADMDARRGEHRPRPGTGK